MFVLEIYWDCTLVQQFECSDWQEAYDYGMDIVKSNPNAPLTFFIDEY